MFGCLNNLRRCTLVQAVEGAGAGCKFELTQLKCITYTNILYITSNDIIKCNLLI